MFYLWAFVWSFPGLRACKWIVWNVGAKPSRSGSSRRTTASSKLIRETFATYASKSKIWSIDSYEASALHTCLKLNCSCFPKYFMSSPCQVHWLSCLFQFISLVWKLRKKLFYLCTWFAQWYSQGPKSQGGHDTPFRQSPSPKIWFYNITLP